MNVPVFQDVLSVPSKKRVSTMLQFIKSELERDETSLFSRFMQTDRKQYLLSVCKELIQDCTMYIIWKSPHDVVEETRLGLYKNRNYYDCLELVDNIAAGFPELDGHVSLPVLSEYNND